MMSVLSIKTGLFIGLSLVRCRAAFAVIMLVMVLVILRVMVPLIVLLKCMIAVRRLACL